MTSEPSAIDVDAREWALRTLNRDASHRFSDIPSLLRLVTDSDYLLSGELANAAQIVAGASALSDCPSIVNHAAWNRRRDLLREQVAEFRRVYFDLSCEERNRQWNCLMIDCSDYSDLAATLRRLKSGLDVTLPRMPEDSRLRHFSQICRDMFLASPLIAARLRQSLSRQWQADAAAWNRAIRGLSKKQFNSFQTIVPWLRESRWKQLCRLQNRQQRMFNFLEPPAPAMATKQQQPISQNPRSYISGLMVILILIVFRMAITMWAHPRSPVHSSRGGVPNFTRNLDWPPDNSPSQRLNNDSPRIPASSEDSAASQKTRDAAFETTRILMGLPRDLSPEQRKQVERGFQSSEIRGSAE